MKKRRMSSLEFALGQNKRDDLKHSQQQSKQSQQQRKSILVKQSQQHQQHSIQHVNDFIQFTDSMKMSQLLQYNKLQEVEKLINQREAQITLSSKDRKKDKLNPVLLKQYTDELLRLNSMRKNLLMEQQQMQEERIKDTVQKMMHDSKRHNKRLEYYKERVNKAQIKQDRVEKRKQKLLEQKQQRGELAVIAEEQQPSTRRDNTKTQPELNEKAHLKQEFEGEQNQDHEETEMEQLETNQSFNLQINQQLDDQSKMKDALTIEESNQNFININNNNPENNLNLAQSIDSCKNISTMVPVVRTIRYDNQYLAVVLDGKTESQTQPLPLTPVLLITERRSAYTEMTERSIAEQLQHKLMAKKEQQNVYFAKIEKLMKQQSVRLYGKDFINKQTLNGYIDKLADQQSSLQKQVKINSKSASSLKNINQHNNMVNTQNDISAFRKELVFQQNEIRNKNQMKELNKFQIKGSVILQNEDQCKLLKRLLRTEALRRKLRDSNENRQLKHDVVEHVQSRAQSLSLQRRQVGDAFQKKIDLDKLFFNKDHPENFLSLNTVPIQGPIIRKLKKISKNTVFKNTLCNQMHNNNNNNNNNNNIIQQTIKHGIQLNDNHNNDSQEESIHAYAKKQFESIEKGIAWNRRATSVIEKSARLEQRGMRKRFININRDITGIIKVNSDLTRITHQEAVLQKIYEE